MCVGFVSIATEYVNHTGAHCQSFMSHRRIPPAESDENKGSEICLIKKCKHEKLPHPKRRDLPKNIYIYPVLPVK